MRNKTLTGAIALFLLNGVEAALVITSQGAWTNTAVISPSSGGVQVNTNTGGAFGANYYYAANIAAHVMKMQTAAGNVQQYYTAGYTYNYKVTGFAAAATHTNTIMTGTLLGNGSAISGTLISGLNNSGGWNAGGTGTAVNAISGSYAVSSNSAEAGQTIGLSISVANGGVQTRFFNNGSTTVKAILTDHAGFNGNGNIYSTSFDTNALGGLIATDYVLDMTRTGAGSILNGYIALNNNTTARNILSIGSVDDTFRAGTIYRISFDANKQLSGDASQNNLTVSLGIFSTNITIGASTTNYSFDVNATSASIAGQLLNIGMVADAVTATGVNQYRIYDLTIQAIPELATFSLTVNSGNGDGSYTNGEQVAITADAPASGYVFDQWIGDTQYVASVSSSNTTVTMPAQAVTVTATYIATEQYTTNGTPYSWLDGYGLTNHVADDVLDQDVDGLKTWQEYIAGTVPTNAASCLKVAQATRNTVTWSAVSGRLYSVYWSTNLVKGFTNLVAGITYPQGSYTNTTPDAKVNHYQIRVQLQ